MSDQEQWQSPVLFCGPLQSLRLIICRDISHAWHWGFSFRIYAFWGMHFVNALNLFLLMISENMAFVVKNSPYSWITTLFYGVIFIPMKSINALFVCDSKRYLWWGHKMSISSPVMFVAYGCLKGMQQLQQKKTTKDKNLYQINI